MVALSTGFTRPLQQNRNDLVSEVGTLWPVLRAFRLTVGHRIDLTSVLSYMQRTIKFQRVSRHQEKKFEQGNLCLEIYCQKILAKI